MAAVASFGKARARLLILRAKDALRDPWCIRSGSLTGSPGGCHCVRRGSNFKNLNNKNSLMDVVTTAVPSADAASDGSRLTITRGRALRPSGSRDHLRAGRQHRGFAWSTNLDDETLGRISLLNILPLVGGIPDHALLAGMHLHRMGVVPVGADAAMAMHLAAGFARAICDS